MIFEVIVGTELIIMCKDNNDLRRLLRAIKEYLDESLTKMLSTLLFSCDEREDINVFINEVLLQNPTIIAENVRAINEASKEVELLRTNIDNFWQIMK